jgi:hypothetical protein
MESTRDTLLKRLDELKAQKYEAMRRASEAYEIEIKLIEKMLEVYDEAKGSESLSPNERSNVHTGDLFADPQFGLSSKEITKKLGKTSQDMILEVLENQPAGLSALDILAEINRRWLPDLPRTSLSPQISRLGQKGKVKQVNGLWRLSHVKSK